jgi:hypothetical protein
MKIFVRNRMDIRYYKGYAESVYLLPHTREKNCETQHLCCYDVVYPFTYIIRVSNVNNALKLYSNSKTNFSLFKDY